MYVCKSVCMRAYNRRTKVNIPLRNGTIFRVIKQNAIENSHKTVMPLTLSHKIKLLTNIPYLSTICYRMISTKPTPINVSIAPIHSFVPASCVSYKL